MINCDEKKYSYNDLLDIMEKLRSENGCPWDKVQTHESLKKYLIEETYEVLEAIDLNDKDKLCEELGDLLLQVVFHAQIAKEKEVFSMEEIVDGISKKMVSRHRHVFGDKIANTPDDVIDIWEKEKKKEKGLTNTTQALKDIPKNLPALMRSYKVQKKAAQVGFDWDNIKDAFEKVEEEINELKNAISNEDRINIEEEVGDILFAIVNVSRFLKVQPEIALTGSTEKFINRFEYIETKALATKKNLEDMTLEEMDSLWDEAKKGEGK